MIGPTLQGPVIFTIFAKDIASCEWWLLSSNKALHCEATVCYKSQDEPTDEKEKFER
jgi:hypothetical protein